MPTKIAASESRSRVESRKAPKALIRFDSRATSPSRASKRPPRSITRPATREYPSPKSTAAPTESVQPRMVRVSGGTRRAESSRTSGCRSWRRESFTENGLRGSRCGRLKRSLLSGGHRRLRGGRQLLPLLGGGLHGRLVPVLEDQGPPQVAERGRDDGHRGDGEDRADDAVEGRPRERGEEDPQRVDADRAALDPRHQDVPLELLGHEKEPRDYQGRVEGPDEGDDLGQAYPQPDEERVLADHEERYGPAYDAHDRAEGELPFEVPDQGPLDGVEELDGVVAHRLGDHAQRGAGDPLPVEEQVDGDYEHEQEVEHGAEGAEDPANEARGHVEGLPGGGGVALEELRDRPLVQPDSGDYE